MKPENRALLGLVVAVVVVTGAVGGYLLLSTPPTGLPIPAGTVFSMNETEQWAVHFSVGPSGGRLTGAWTAYDGIGYVGLVVVNGTVNKPSPPVPLHCPLLQSWTEWNATISRTLHPGAFTVYWNTGFCAAAERIVVTQTIQLQAA